MPVCWQLRHVQTTTIATPAELSPHLTACPPSLNLQCVNGWEKVDTACTECTPGHNCGTFAAETCDCTKCDSGFALDGTACTACPEGQDPNLCESYDDAGVTCVCTACKDAATYDLVDGACVPVRWAVGVLRA